MVHVKVPKYLKITDIQSILTYIFNETKRPNFIQLKTTPHSVLVVKIELKGCSTEQCTGVEEKAAAPLATAEQCSRFLAAHPSLRTSCRCTSNCGVSNACEHSEVIDYDRELDKLRMNRRIHINENMTLDSVFRSMLKSMEAGEPRLECITEASLEMVEKQDIRHLFSYSEFIRSQAAFDESAFECFSRPNSTSKHFLVAVDCEMMETVEGRQVGRVTVLDHMGQSLYDRFVQPSAQVIDYLEQYSGLTQQNTSQGVTFSEMLSSLLRIIGTNTYVLGHGLENDLGALQFYTERVIDTSYLFLSSEGYKIKLRQLSKKYFSQKIQEKTHSSSEDAMCCLKLLALKIQQLKMLKNPDTPLIELNAEVVYDSIDILRPCNGESTRLPSTPRRIVMADLNSIRSEELQLDENIFLILLYKKNGNNYLAFRQPS